MSLHEFHLQEAIENAKSKVRHILEDSQLKIKSLEENLIETKQKLEAEIQRNKDYIKSLLQTNGELEREVIIRDHRIGELTEMDSRDIACVEMSRIFKKLNQYIGESEDQQKKQVATLVSISHVMSLAEELDSKPALIETGSQSIYNMPNTSLPELDFPILSKNPFYHISKEISSQMIAEDAFETCKSVFDNAKLETCYYRQLGEYLMVNYNKDICRNYLVKITSTVYNSKTTKGLLYSYLLGYPKLLPLACEKIVFRINQIIPNPESNAPDGCVNLQKALESVYNYPILRKPVEKILEKLTYVCPSFNNIEISKQIFVIMCRCQLTIEKAKKSLKVQLESQDFKKEGTCK